MDRTRSTEQVTRCADRFAAMGAEPRLRIIRLLVSADPDGMVVGDIQGELAIPSSTLSHHLEKLKNEDLITVRREGTYLWYKANTAALQELLNFLYAECCTRNKVLKAEDLIQIRQGRSTALRDALIPTLSLRKCRRARVAADPKRRSDGHSEH
jgi:ArsR family transcriptional regulator